MLDIVPGNLGMYKPDESGELWWCNSHARRATFLTTRYVDSPNNWMHVCDPKLGGILLPCQTVNLTKEVELC